MPPSVEELGVVVAAPNAEQTCHFINLPLELRLEIYKLVLPAHKFFSVFGSPNFQEFDLALVKTCKMIFKEAYPVFLSTNNFQIDQHPKGWGPEPRSWDNNIHEVTFDWYPERYIMCGTLNAWNLQDAFEFSQLHTVHVKIVAATMDETYTRFKARYREEGAKKTYLELSYIKVVLSIPGIRKVTMGHSVTDNTPDLVALGEYMTEQLTVLDSTELNTRLSEEKVLSIIKDNFTDVFSDNDDDDDDGNTEAGIT